MKYVMFKSTAGRKFPIVFPDNMVHSQVALLIMVVCKSLTNESVRAVSAGFIEFGSDIKVHGKSESLGLAFNPADIARFTIGESAAFMPDEELTKLYSKLGLDEI